MAVDMLLTKAVVTCAAGTVTEFQLRILRIRPAADGTFVPVEVRRLFPADFPGCFFEVDRRAAFSGRADAEQCQKIIPAEDEHVDDRHHRQEIDWEGVCEDSRHEEECIHNGEPFHLDGYNEEQQHLHVGIECRKREEHRKEYILCRDIHRLPCDKVHQEAVKDRQNHAGEEIDGKLCSAPLLLQRCADQIVKIKCNQCKRAGRGRNKDKRNNPPDLPMQNITRVKSHIRENPRVDDAQQPEDHIGNGDVFYQMGNAKIRMCIAEFIDLFFQDVHLAVFYASIILLFPAEFYKFL